MATLADLVHGLAGRPGVTAAVVASPDGLPITQSGVVSDPEALAALTVTIARTATRLADTGALGAPARLVVECANGLAIFGLVRGGNWLLLLTDADADIGQLLYDLRQEGPALAAQL